MLKKQELIIALAEAYRAMLLEYMNCPSCYGYIGGKEQTVHYGSEPEKDQAHKCFWLKFIEEYPNWQTLDENNL